ncbi:hypothetical protein WDU94_012965 [Cyamophila willieti]
MFSKIVFPLFLAAVSMAAVAHCAAVPEPKAVEPLVAEASAEKSTRVARSESADLDKAESAYYPSPYAYPAYPAYSYAYSNVFRRIPILLPIRQELLSILQLRIPWLRVRIPRLLLSKISFLLSLSL